MTTPGVSTVHCWAAFMPHQHTINQKVRSTGQLAVPSNLPVPLVAAPALMCPGGNHSTLTPAMARAKAVRSGNGVRLKAASQLGRLAGAESLATVVSIVAVPSGCGRQRSCLSLYFGDPRGNGHIDKWSQGVSILLWHTGREGEADRLARLPMVLL